MSKQSFRRSNERSPAYPTLTDAGRTMRRLLIAGSAASLLGVGCGPTNLAGEPMVPDVDGGTCDAGSDGGEDAGTDIGGGAPLPDVDGGSS